MANTKKYRDLLREARIWKRRPAIAGVQLEFQQEPTLNLKVVTVMIRIKI